MRTESDSVNQQLQRGRKEMELAWVFGKKKRMEKLAGGPRNASWAM